MPAARRAARRAFTLIELMIVISVIALLAAAASPALGALTGADARKGAGELAAAMRWLYDGASIRHATCRLVLSPAQSAYWAECAPGRTPIARDAEQPERALPKEVEELTRKGDVSFKKFDDPVVSTRGLPGGSTFKVIRIDGRDALVEGRDAYIHFFPGGRSQAARVTIGEGSHLFTIRLEPFTGRARVSPGEPEERDE